MYVMDLYVKELLAMPVFGCLKWAGAQAQVLSSKDRRQTTCRSSLMMWLVVLEMRTTPVRRPRQRKMMMKSALRKHVTH